MQRNELVAEDVESRYDGRWDFNSYRYSRPIGCHSNTIVNQTDAIDFEELQRCLIQRFAAATVVC